VLTNFIQADPASSGSVDRSALPLQFAGPGPNSFASTLHTAGAPAPATPRSELVAVAGREKPAEKKTAEDSRKTQPGQAMPAMGLAVNADVKLSSLIANKPETILPVLQDSTGLSGSVPIPGKSSQSDDAIGLAGAASPAAQEISVGPAIPPREFQQGAAFVLSKAAVDTKPSAGSDPALSKDVAVAPAEQVTPLAAGAARSQLTPLDETKAGTQMPPADKVAEESVASSEPSAILPSALAGLDTPPLSLAPSTADFAGNAGKGDPKPAISPPSVPLNSPHPDSGPPNVAGVNLDASDATTQSGSGSTRGSPEALASSSVASQVASSMSFPPEISRPISAHAVTPMKSLTTTLAVDAHVKESYAARVTTNPEHTTSKTADVFSNSSDTNVLPPSPSAVPASPIGPPTSSEQPGITVPNVLLAQVSPATNQDPGSHDTPLPAAERQAPAASPPASLPAASTVEVARLVAGVAQSEMHIGLRTQAFGSVEVHTVVRDSQVGLTVGSERGDLRSLLAPEVSGLQSSFRQQDLRFDNIHFLETSAGTTAGFSGGADSHSRSSSQQHASTEGLFTIQNTQEDPAELDVGAGSRVRLNVHA
jgi:hypothetical protein